MKSPPGALSDKWALSVIEAVQLSGLGRTTIYEALSAGQLKAVKAGRRTLILAEDLRHWLEGLPAVEPKS
jgi:excisionase family DNA binding protein